MADFWDNGSLPHPAELRSYLERQGIVSTDIDSILAEYEETIVGGVTTYNWTQDQVNDWVSSKVRGAAQEEEGKAVGGPDAQIRDMVADEQAQAAAASTRHADLAEQRTEVVGRQLSSYYDQMTSVGDDDVAYGAGLASSIALGVRVDEAGNPIIGPDGMPMPITPTGLWDEIRGMKFNMGALSMPYDVSSQRQRQAASGRTGSELLAGYGATDDSEQRWVDPRSYPNDSRASGRSQQELLSGYSGPRIRGKRNLTPSEALAMLTSMDENYLTTLQQEMWEAGLYERVAGEGAIPTWGRADVATRKALIEMFTEASLDPTASVSDVLNNLAEQRISRLAPPEGGPGAESNIPDFNPEVTSAETLAQTIDEIAQNLRGEFASDDEKNALVKTLQDKEVANQRELYDRSVADLLQGGAGAAAGGGGGGTEEIDRFMAALAGKESGGDYNAVNADSGASGKFQIMPGNWPSWASRAGLSPDAPRTPANQELVAKRIMLDYYQQFGNWRDVAVAWYSGPGRVNELRYSDRPQGRYPSINDYANDVMARFGRQSAAGVPGMMGGDINAAIERFDPAAEAQAILKAQDPAGWQAHEYSDRAIEFFGLLGGVV